MAIREILKENQPEVKNKNNEKLSEEDIKELMGSRRYKRVNGALRQI